MPRVVAYEDAKSAQKTRRGTTRTPFLGSIDTPQLPVAFLSQGDPDRVIRPHWHVVDQFQVIVGGNGRLGRHEVDPYYVHFSRAYTPYGPLVGSSKTGISFFTMRARYDPGAQYLPESRERLRQIADRHPWQISQKITFPSGTSGTHAGAINLQKVPGMEDDVGLSAYSLSMGARETTIAPNPSNSGGQFILVVKGSLWYGEKEHRAYTTVFSTPGDDAFHVEAGTDGLQAIVLSFPRANTGVAAASIAAAG